MMQDKDAERVRRVFEAMLMVLELARLERAYEGH
jgi:hypothetical protein